MSYHPSGKYLVSSSLDSTIKIWDAFNSQILYTVHGHQGPVNSVAFSRDGDYICSGGNDTTLMVWKNNLAGIGYPAKSKYPEDEGLSKPVTIPRRRNKSKTGLRCCKGKNKTGTNASSYKKEEMKSNSRLKSGKSTMNSKNSNPNLQSNVFDINTTIKSNGMVLNATNQTNNNSNNVFNYLPPEMKVTFEKMVSQLDLVIKTIKIFDQRIQNIEGHISTLYNRRKKGFVQKQPPQMGDYQFLLENSSNFIPNNSMNNGDGSQNNINPNNFDYYTGNYNPNVNFRETMNLNDDNKKNVFQTEININKISQNVPNEEDDKYKDQMQENFGYNGNQGEEQVNDGDEQNKFGNENEYANEQEYEQEGEEYMNEQEYDQGEEQEQEQEQEQDQDQGGEEEPAYDYNNEEMNDENGDMNKSK